MARLAVSIETFVGVKPYMYRPTRANSLTDRFLDLYFREDGTLQSHEIPFGGSP